MAVLVGMGLGAGADYLFGSKPFGLLIGLGFGFAAGLRNTLRLATRMQAENADVPIGDDIGFDDLDDEN